MKYLPKALLLLAMVSCTGDAGKIPITLDLSTVADTAQIKRFIFVVKDPTDPAGLSLLFPKECTGCSSSVTPCAAADVCVNIRDCGFEVSEGKFNARVDFSDFANDSDMKLIACATNGTALPIIAQGSSIVKNTVGQTANVVLTTSDTSCSVLPSVCP